MWYAPAVVNLHPCRAVCAGEPIFSIGIGIGIGVVADARAAVEARRVVARVCTVGDAALPRRRHDARATDTLQRLAGRADVDVERV